VAASASNLRIDDADEQERCSTAADDNTSIDDGLMKELQQGNSRALGELFRRHWQRLLRIAVRVLENYYEAEELVQDTFLYVWKRAQSFDPQRSPAKFWLSQVTYCRALDRRDYLSARHFYDSMQPSDLFELIGTDASPEKDLASLELRRDVKRALADLSAGQRMTLELFFFEGYTLVEISQYLGEPLGNVRHHYYRGLLRLRHKFDQSTRKMHFASVARTS